MTENEEPIKQDEKKYSKVEQLDDVDFEKEKMEKPKNKKTKNIIILIIGIIVFIAIGLIAYIAIGMGNPKIVIEDFVSNVNSKKFDEALKYIDLKGMYTLITTYEGEEVDDSTNLEKYYTKFDSRYKEIENNEEYKEFVSLNKTVNDEVKTFFEDVEFKITEIHDPVLIQNTKGLYKVKTNVDMIYDKQTQSIEIDFYVNKSIFKYQLVGGYIPELLVSINEHYNELEKNKIKTDKNFVNEAKTPEDTITKYAEAFNSQDFATILNLTDLTGFYTLNTITTDENVENYETYYTQFDERYEVAKTEEECEEFIYAFSMITETTIESLFDKSEMTVSNMKSAVLVENTQGLYSVEADVNLHMEGVEDFVQTCKFYVNNTENGYKVVGGDAPSLILYMIYLSQYYGL